jgi:hypothetical protein
MFDPTIPPDGAFATGAALRGQFNGLKALIDAIPAGPAGPPGEVSNVTLAAQIAGTAQNPNVGPLNIALSDPPTRAEVQAILDFMNALVNSLTRV